MKQIKIIKKGKVNAEQIKSHESVTTISKAGERKQETIETVESWVTDWRRQKNAESRRAFD